jgi:hypothetical protein
MTKVATFLLILDNSPECVGLPHAITDVGGAGEGMRITLRSREKE